MAPSSSSDETAATLPSELREQTGIVLALTNSNFYRHFLERFLDGVGRVLRVTWWVIHLALYLAVGVVFVLLIDVPRLYPNQGYFSFWGEQIGEFMFTTFMLFHIRKSRTVAFLAAARISDGKARLIWLRRYLAPTYWGWVVRWEPRRRSKLQWIVRVWFATAFILLVYYLGQFVYYRNLLPWFPHSRSYWDAYYYPYPQLLYLYPTIAKAAMMVAGVAHFWWLYGLSEIVRGRYPSSLTSRQKRSLYFECGQTAIRLSVVVSAATVVWVSAHALAYGFTFWFYLYSLWLLVLFMAQVAIIKDLKPYRRIAGRSFREIFQELIAPDFAISWQFTGIRRFATLSAVWGLILCLGPLAQLAASLGNL